MNILCSSENCWHIESVNCTKNIRGLLSANLGRIHVRACLCGCAMKINTMWDSLYVYACNTRIYKHYKYVWTSFRGERLTTCQFSCSTAAIKSVYWTVAIHWPHRADRDTLAAEKFRVFGAFSRATTSYCSNISTNYSCQYDTRDGRKRNLSFIYSEKNKIISYRIICHGSH